MGVYSGMTGIESKGRMLTQRQHAKSINLWVSNKGEDLFK